MAKKRNIRSAHPRVNARRLVLLPLIAIAAYLGLADSAATVVAKIDPVRARTIAPWNGQITAQAAEEAMLTGARSNGPSYAEELARKALQKDPTAVGALNVLGMLAQSRNDTQVAQRIFGYSLQLSRRELPARYWAIEEAVGRGDIHTALVNYNIALTTSQRAPDALFPILASAISQTKVRAMLIEMLRRGTYWGNSFIHYAATSGSDPRATVAFLREVDAANLPVQPEDRAKLVDTLFSRDLPDEAWAWYASYHRGADRNRGRDERFTAEGAQASVFDWRAAETPGITASIQSLRTGGLVDVSIAPSTSGPVLSQVQALTPGRYRLAGKFAGFAGSVDSRPYWLATCRDGREIARVSLDPAASESFSGDFSVQQGCRWQNLTLIARSSASVGGISGQLQQVSIKALSNVAGSRAR